LLEWSDVLGNETATAILEEILGEEKASNEALTEIAIASSNDEAFGDDEAGNEEGSLKTAFAV
jgi:ferritin-like metal-binding protein YciE